MKTFTIRPETVERDWCVVDTTDETLGRLVSELALRLRDKHRTEHTPHVDTGDHIIILNANKVTITSNKRTGKVYYHRTGHISGIRQVTSEEVIACHPKRVLEAVVKGMLSKGPLGRAMLRKLKICVSNEHNHAVQQPQILDI